MGLKHSSHHSVIEFIRIEMIYLEIKILNNKIENTTVCKFCMTKCAHMNAFWIKRLLVHVWS